MNEKKTGFKWLEKLKKVKHIEIYVAIIFVVIILLIYMSNFSSKSSNKTTNKTISSDQSIAAYIENMENSLEEILTNIGGVSNVKVMITLDMAKADVSDSQITLNSFPPIKGIIVTAKGVSSLANKQKVLQAIEAVLDITNGNIEILSSD